MATITELSDLIRTRRVSPVDVIQGTLARIESLDGRLGAFVTVLSDRARDAATQAETEIASGRYRGPLHGIPFGAKDIIATDGVRTTADSKILANWIPDFDASVIKSLRSAGAILIGKLHSHEFAGGAATSYGPTVNPWDRSHVPGSSSSGSAAAVAACLCPLALGTDTGGSIRQPASFCGIVGLKPTYGRISRFGVLPLSWSLDHVGPMVRSVSDAAIVLNALAGPDKLDGSSRRAKVPDYSKSLNEGIRGVRIGVLGGHFSSPLAPEVSAAFSSALDVLRSNGASLHAVELENVKHVSAVYFTISSAEALSEHEHWLQKHYHDYGDDFRTRLLQGVPILATEYLRAQRVRSKITNEISQALKDVDVLVSPTLPVPAPRFGEESIMINGVAEDPRRIMSRFTAPFNLSGHPAISIPCGFSDKQLPIGLQLAGRAFDEEMVLRVAHAYEQATGRSNCSARIP